MKQRSSCNVPATGGKAKVVELGDCMWHVVRALVNCEVAATSEEALDGIRGGADNEVVVVDKSDEVDEGDEEWVDGLFVGEIWLELGLRTNL